VIGDGRRGRSGATDWSQEFQEMVSNVGWRKYVDRWFGNGQISGVSERRSPLIMN
jgi:hypothetical protein